MRYLEACGVALADNRCRPLESGVVDFVCGCAILVNGFGGHITACERHRKALNACTP